MKITVLSLAVRGIAQVLKNENVSKWAQKVLLTGIDNTPLESESPEEGIMGIRAEDVNLSHLGTQRVSYSPKGIYTEAIEVTRENIGKLALEFDVELRYDRGIPFFNVEVARGTEENPRISEILSFYVGHWIVVLRNEIHRYFDTEFENTFELETFQSEELNDRVPPSFTGTIGKPGSWMTESRPEPLSDDALWATKQISAEEHQARIEDHQ